MPLSALYALAADLALPCFPPPAGLSMSQNVGILTAYWAGMEGLKLTALHITHRLGVF